MSATRTFAVSLTIPDNEAFTAYETLCRLGVPVARVTRSDIWQFEVDEPAGDLAGTIASIESIHNPNKHRLAERPSDRPLAGEVWIGARDERSSALVAGRRIPGVHAVRRRTAWRLLDHAGQNVAPDDLDRAVETFLCNPSFQVAIKAQE